MSSPLLIAERVDVAVKSGESYYREFKSAFEGRSGHKTARKLTEVMKDVGRTLVAFANADGGELLVGVEDDGSITGHSYREEQVQSILDASITHVHRDTPLPPGIKSRVEIGGKEVLFFYVPKGTRYVHLTSDGRCVRREDRESVPVSAEHIQDRRLEDRSRTYDREFDWPRAALQDLDLDLLGAVATQVAYGISPEKCLQYLDLAEFGPDGLKLKNAALLLFAKDVSKWHPRCQVRIVSYNGTDAKTGSDFVVLKDETVSGNILSLTDSAWERLQVAITRHTTLTQQAKFEQSYLYPQLACREALINALVHRNYAIEGRGIEISLFVDRMEIASPGALLSTISLEDLKAQRGTHESRNPLVARVMREVGFVREMGEGIRRIFQVMRSSSMAQPEFMNSNSNFTVTLFNRSMYDESVRLWLANFDKIELTEQHKAILALGYGGDVFSFQDVMDRLGTADVDRVREVISPLRGVGYVARTLADAVIIKLARKNRVPRRAVPSFRVVNPIEIEAGGSSVGSRSNADLPKIDHSQRASASQRGLQTCELYLGNLSLETTREEVVRWLSIYGDVEALTFPGHRAPASSGYAFAVLTTDRRTDELVDVLNGQRLGGRKVLVQIPRRNV